jgi:hypothetical protein
VSAEVRNSFAPELALFNPKKMTTQSTPIMRSPTTPSSLGDIAPLVRINRQLHMVIEPRAALSHHSPDNSRVVANPSITFVTTLERRCCSASDFCVGRDPGVIVASRGLRWSTLSDCTHRRMSNDSRECQRDTLANGVVPQKVELWSKQIGMPG